jgi:hypothetical protein
MRKILLLLATATIASATPFAAIAAESDSASIPRTAAKAIEPAPARSTAREPSEPRPGRGFDSIPWAGLDLKWVSKPGSAMRTGPSDIIG